MQPQFPRSVLLMVPLLLAACNTSPAPVVVKPVDLKASLTVAVEGLPTGQAADISVQLDQLTPVKLTGSKMLDGLPLGTYTTTAQTVMSQGVPYLPTVTPARVTFTNQNLKATVNVAYALPATGQMTLNVMGLPAGEHTLLHLTGPNGFKRDLKDEATQTLTDLAPGAYNVSADAVRSGDFTYPASVQPATVTVERGRTSVSNISFARDPRLGNLSVRVLGQPEGSVPALEITGATTRTLTGSGIVTDLPTGTYTVTGADIHQDGITYRASASSVAIEGATTTPLDVTYAPVTGRLQVVVNSPVDVPAGLISVVGLRDLKASTLLDDVKPDVYTVSAAAFTQDGWTYVPEVQPTSVTVVAGQTAGTTVTYVPRVAQAGVKVDVMAPGVTLDEDAGLASLSGTASDDSGAVEIEAFVGTTSLGRTTPDSDGHWTLAWPNREGNDYEVTVIATDPSGNTTRLTQNLNPR